MIQFNNNIYKTLDDKFYYGNKQVGYVYYGDKLIYPESKIEIDGIIIDTSPYYLNGNMYDTGISATKDLCFEICMIPNISAQSSKMIFGTHHDNWTAAKSTFYRETDGSKGNKRESDLILSDKPYPNKSSFHLILGSDQKMRFRYGGEQKNYSSEGSSGSDIELSTASITGQQKYTISLGETDSNGKKTILSGFEYGPYYWDSEIKAGRATEQQKTDAISKLKKDKISTKINNEDVFGDNASAHLWINAVNRYLEEPFLTRPKDNNNDDDDINYYYDTTNSAFLYLIFWGKNQREGTIYDDKMIFVQKIIDTSNGSKMVVFERHLWDSQKQQFKQEVDKTIYPFKYCKP